MPGNIKCNNTRAIRFRCINDEYYDFMLYRGDVASDTIPSDALIAYLTPSGVSEDDKLHSSVIWPDAKNDTELTGTTLYNAGLTNVDNGLIQYRRDIITNEEFVNIFTGSTYSISSENKELLLSPVSGNTSYFIYPIEINEDERGKYFTFKGGFYQGFYKLFGYDYQTLPNFIDNNEWNMFFELRPRNDYNIQQNTINYLHPENKGIFFYMGTRAENKFWHGYNTEGMEEYRIPSAVDEGYFPEDWDLQNYVTDLTYVGEDEPLEECECEEPDDCSINYSLNPEYWAKDLDLDDIHYEIEDIFDLDKKGYYEIVTDNKFILYHRAEGGFTVDDGDVGEVTLTGRNDWDEDNYYLLFNRTETGLTIDDIDEYHEQHTKVYDINKDIYNNSIAFRIDDNGRIGYRIGVKNCSTAETSYEIIEEYSKENIVKVNEWNKVNVKITILNQDERNQGKRKMKLYFYVNGYLVLISKELPEFNFKELNDIYQKQEGVPYNISLGGGTQGLLEEIFFHYYYLTNYCLPIEKNFCGSFIGDIRSFKFYDEPLNYQMIKKETK